MGCDISHRKGTILEKEQRKEIFYVRENYKHCCWKDFEFRTYNKVRDERKKTRTDIEGSVKLRSLFYFIR